MRNLRCISYTQRPVETHLPCTSSTWDSVNDALLYTLGPSKQSSVIDLRRVSASHNDDTHLVASWDAPCPLPELEVDGIVSLHHLVASETTCLVLTGGDIVIVRSAPLPGQERIEIVGSVDAGISAAEWAPDEDLLAITTRANTLLFMTADFDNIASATFSPEDVNLSKQVSVGWGKRETQFQGKRAKALRDPTVPEHVDQGIRSPQDDGNVAITWRGDGAYVAVSTIQPQGRRMIRVYSREGTLDSVSEAVDHQLAALAWKPSGQLIASVQRGDDQAQVVFFERNGLRHGEFSLRLDAPALSSWATRIELAWNADSTVLAVTFLDRVQLWTMGNYHYYLKQEILSTDPTGAAPLRSLRWHPEDPLRLQFAQLTHTLGPAPPAPSVNGDVANDGGFPARLSILSFAWTLSETPISPPHDLGVVLVIDGCTLRVTPLRIASVPPRMAFQELCLAKPATDAAVSGDNSEIAVVHRGSISVFRRKAGVQIQEYEVAEHIELPIAHGTQALQVTYSNAGEVHMLLRDLLNDAYMVYTLTKRQVVYRFDGLASTVHLYRSSDTHEIHVYHNGTSIQLYSPGDDQNNSHQAVGNILHSIREIRACTIYQQSVRFGLTSNGTLFANERILFRNCTSFLLTDSHLVVTTSNHLLKFVHLNASATDLNLPADDPEVDERCRNIERGAKLVAVMPSTFAVTLQMPRGNLETVYPRALVLAGVRRNIDRQQYKKAFLACRNHRVDMNILHDYKPRQFLEDIPLIIKQLSKAEFIDLLLSQLSEQDVSTTLYRNTLPNAPLGLDDEYSVDRSGDVLRNAQQSKVNRICDGFLQALQANASKRLQNIITAHVCKDPPDTEAALTVIASLGDVESEQVETAVEHVCFLTDVNKIYDTSLGMYNLDLALAVAQQSQKDPREYLPYLQSLQALPETEQRFRVNDDLKRYTKALGHLHELQDLDRFVAYAEKHALYSQALERNKYNMANHARILRSYASFLSSCNRYCEAATAYESLSLYQEASEAYASAQMWRESLSSAYLSNAAPDAIQSLARSLADGLIESKDYSSAAAILSEHINNIPEAARTFCKGYRFSDAIRLLALHNEHRAVPEIIDAELGEAFSTLTELTSDCRSQITAQVPRIRELRDKKARDPLAFYEGTAEAGEGADIPDNISLAPSETTTAGGTLLTRYTGRNTGTVATGTSRRTSKNRRREERKRARGKKGSVYEEEYLVNSVGRLIDRVNETLPDVQATIETLCRRGMWERARALQAGFAELLEGCEKCVSEVWDVQSKESDPVTQGEVTSERPLGADGVLWDSLEEAKKVRPPPVVKSFTRSAMLSG